MTAPELSYLFAFGCVSYVTFSVLGWFGDRFIPTAWPLGVRAGVMVLLLACGIPLALLATAPLMMAVNP